MALRCGTSGFSFREWKGSFYPASLPAGRMLAFYAERLPAVEINSTFYRMPRRGVIGSWRDQVPGDFRFVIKASRRISHLLRLKDCDEAAGYLFSTCSELGDRLGAILVQLPPNFRVDVERLEGFLALVPDATRVAFEFRHESWRTDDVRDLLAAHGAATVIADRGGDPPDELPDTATWGYVRLRAPDYRAAQLRAWRDRLAAFDQAYVFFKHEDSGKGPELARQMQQLADDP